MKNLYFDNFEDFSCVIADKFDELYKENFEDIAVIAKPDEAKEIFKELVCMGYDICNITYERIDWDGYDDEYILSMNHDGIWLEKFKREDGKYLTDESTITYILDNCSSKVIPYCKGKNVYEVTVVGDDDCNCDECEKCLTINGKPATKEEFDRYVSQFKKDEKPTTTTSSSTASKSTYRVNGEEVDKDTYVNALRTIEDMYTKNISETLSGYSDFVEEMHKWKRLLGWQYELNNIVWKGLMVDVVGCRLFLFGKREYISVTNNWSVSQTGKENYSHMTISAFNYKNWRS